MSTSTSDTSTGTSTNTNQSGTTTNTSQSSTNTNTSQSTGTSTSSTHTGSLSHTSMSTSSPPTSTPTGPRRPADIHKGHFADSGHSSWGWVILSLLIIFFLAGTAYFLYAHWRARRLGVPGPRLNPFSDRNAISGSRSGGAVGWVQDKIAGFRRQRTAGGAYEGNSGVGGRRGRGMDPDEAWDTRVGNEADVYGGPPGYYEEQELSGLRGGMHDESAYAGGGYGRPAPGYGPAGSLDELEVGETRGRQRELDDRYEQEMGTMSNNPFDDQHAEPSNMSLRGVSPRPHVDDSPTERRSMFKENV